MEAAQMRFMTTIAIAAAIAATSGIAQVNQRKENQQDRIAQGVASGRLSAHETAKLEKQEAAINQEVHVDRALNGGKLTPAERKQVNVQQNRMSTRIYADKHNPVKQPAHQGEVGARQANQQNRIADGIASGKLNAAEASRLEKGEAAINHEVHTDRSVNGGKLTPAERKQVNRQQTVMSRKIDREKN
jgi:hypothetical protein